MTYSFFYASKLDNFAEKKRLKQTGRLFRAHINTAQNLLNIAPHGSKQGVFGALTHTEKNTVKNGRLVT